MDKTTISAKPFTYDVKQVGTVQTYRIKDAEGNVLAFAVSLSAVKMICECMNDSWPVTLKQL